jgi:Spy/CpxP family protein refolding chaperone
MVSKAGAVVVLGFALALLGGGAAGLLAARYFGAGAPPVQPVQTVSLPLSQELHLTPDQRENIRKIWEGMRQTADSCLTKMDWLNHQRDQDILKLLTPDQQAKFEEINRKYQDESAAQVSKRQAAFNEAVAETKKLLKPEQRARYESILAQRMGNSVGEGHGPVQEGTARSGNSSLQLPAKSLPSPG